MPTAERLTVGNGHDLVKGSGHAKPPDWIVLAGRNGQQWLRGARQQHWRIVGTSVPPTKAIEAGLACPSLYRSKGRSNSHTLRSLIWMVSTIATGWICWGVCIAKARGDMIASSQSWNEAFRILLLLFPRFMEYCDSCDNREDHESKWDDRPHDTPTLWRATISLCELTSIWAVDLAKDEIVTLLHRNPSVKAEAWEKQEILTISQTL